MEEEADQNQPQPHDNSPSRSLIACIHGWIKKIIRILLVILNNGYCIPTYTLWMLIIMPIKSLSVHLYYKIEGLFFHWLLAMVSLWSWSAGYSIVELGDDIESCMSERALVLANHQSTADVPLLMATFNAKRGVLPNIMWIMDRIFKFTNFGIVSVLHEDFFIVSGKERREQSLRELSKHLHNSYIPRHRKWIVLFPEGGFLRKRRETSQRFAQKENLPLLEHVSLPRVGAMRVIMENVGNAVRKEASEVPDVPAGSQPTSPEKKVSSEQSQSPESTPTTTPNNHVNSQVLSSSDCDSDSNKLRWVIDITIAYPKGEPLDLPTIVTGSRPPCQTYLFYRRYPLSEIPTDEEGMKQWLYQRFVEKEAMLRGFYETGELPGKEWFRQWVPPHEVVQDPLRFIVIHIFFLTSSYIHYFFLSSVFSYVWEHLAWYSL